ncbi:MAG TPA: hypothetical protein VNQ73_23875 [Ilumatobacter sp.]|nr:hypothetical protein [Ilumatobacter sp.]
MAPTDPAQAVQIERWFLQRGVPHFIDQSHSTVLDTWTRAIPLLVPAYVLLGLNALDLDSSLRRNLAIAGVAVVVLVGTWMVSNLVRRQPPFARPTDIGWPEVTLFLVGPALASAVSGQWGDAAETVGYGLVLLAVIRFWSSYGIGPLLRWTWRRGRSQLTGLGPLVAKAVPLLLLFNMFLFINAEVWEVAADLTLVAYLVVVAILFTLGLTFTMSRIPGVIGAMNRFDSWDDIEALVAGTPAAGACPPGDCAANSTLPLRQRLNVGLVVLLGQGLQVLLVVLALVAFFVVFGFLAISPEVTMAWTGHTDLDPLLTATIDGRQHALTRELLAVSVFLGMFSGMYFNVVLATDVTYQTEFADDVAPEVRQVLAVRRVYQVIRAGQPT